MKVFIDGHMFKQAQGGISRVWRETLGRVAAKSPAMSFTVYVLSRGRRAVPVSPRIKTIVEWDLPPRAFWKSLSRKRAQVTSAHIFHSTYYTEPFVKASRRVVTVYDFNHERLPGVTGSTNTISLKRRAIENADSIIAISATTKEHLIQLYRIPPDRVVVMPLACNEVFAARKTTAGEIEQFCSEHRLHTRYWLSVGRRGTYKNFTTLLKAFAKIAAETDGMLVVVGGRPELEPSEIDLLVTHRLEHRVVLLAGVSDETLRVAYAGAVAFIFPSLAEGFGLPLLEAMAAGCPVAASDIPVFREIAADAAVYFDPHCPEHLAQKMIELLNPDVRAKLMELGRRRSREFSWDKSADILRGVYEGLV